MKKLVPWFPFIPILLLSDLFCSTSTAVTETNNTTDRDALLSFKSLIVDDPLTALASWNNHTLHHCQWQGISCDSAIHPDRVTSLVFDSFNLAGSLSPSLGNLTALSYLYLPNNRFTGQIPSQIGRLSLLEVLVLSNNSLSGNIPVNLSWCKQLDYLFLDTNFLFGKIPNEVGFLTKLIKLKLYTNNLTGSIPVSIGNLSSLRVLDLSENSLEGNLPESFQSLVRLEFLQLSYNNLSGNLSPSLCNFSFVYYYDIGSNQLLGSLPQGIGYNLPKLRRFYLYSNQLEGSIPISLSNASNLERIGLEDNSFSGSVPTEIASLANISWLSFGSNQLYARQSSDWDFLSDLTNRSNFQVLDLSGNKFSGLLPSSIANLSIQLQWLSMENNEISGSIPARIGRYINLAFFSIFNNFLTGSIPTTIGRLQNLDILRLSGNKLSGEIPSSLGNITQLNELDLGANGFYGRIPRSIGNLQNLNLLNISFNWLNGTIPAEVLSLSSLSRYLDLSHNSLSGLLPIEIGTLKNLVVLNLSDNQLYGDIPTTIGECQMLGYLHIAGNSFEGEIPRSLSNLKGLQNMDLSRNNLSGTIPEFLASFQILQYLNLSYNNFEGELPEKGIFRNVSAFSVAGNRKLCGDNPILNLNICAIHTSNSRHKFHKLKEIKAIASAGIFVAILLPSLAYCYFMLKTRQKSLVTLARYDHSKLSYDDLFKATNGFSFNNLIGVGSFGSVYKGFLNYDQRFVAVKVLNLERRGASKSFMAECEVLRNTRHRNLVKIITASSSVDPKGKEFKALVLEFMPKGSLENWLHPRTEESSTLNKLSFSQRLNIAIDVASALDYLHLYCEVPIIHCDLKPSNVLLDEAMVGHVSDFGLARFLPENGSASANAISTNGIRGSIGYIAPEYALGSRVSTEADAYSFGILLLEMFTGKRPTDETFREGLTLYRYAEVAFPDRIMDIIDASLLSEEDISNHSEDIENAKFSRWVMKDGLVSIIGIGLSCSKEWARERKNMADVVHELLRIRDQLT